MDLGSPERGLLAEALRRFAPEGEAKADARAAPPRFSDYVATLFGKQREVLAAPESRVGVLCTRRAGKSKAIPALLMDAGERFPGTVVYYIHPDGGQRAEETINGPDIDMPGVIERFRLPWDYNANKRRFRHRVNKSEIRIRGADDAREIRKYRGDKVSRVVLDESQNFPGPLLARLLDSDLGPALADVGGQFFLLGTPGEVCGSTVDVRNPWYEVTRNEDADSLAKRLRGWRVIEWSALDNPHMMRADRGFQAPKEIAKRLLPYTDKSEAELVALLLTPEGREVCKALAVEDPTILREWWGLWVNDAGALFYAWKEERNTYDGNLPSGHHWLHVLGVDLGHNPDAFATVVWAVSATHPVMYERESFSERGLYPEDWRQKTKDSQQRWSPVSTVVDEGGLGKAEVEEWRDRHAMTAKAAEKAGKAAAVATFNAELRAGNVKTLPNSPLSRELSTLPKDPRSPPGEPAREHPSFANHCTDAGLYSFREARPFMGRADAPKPPPGSREALEAESAAYEQRLIAQLRDRATGEDSDGGGY